MKIKIIIILLLTVLFSSCTETHIEFDINWIRVLKVFCLVCGGAICGAVIVLAIFVKLFNS